MVQVRLASFVPFAESPLIAALGFLCVLFARWKLSNPHVPLEWQPVC
jgi:hypothetical protein